MQPTRLDQSVVVPSFVPSFDFLDGGLVPSFGFVHGGHRSLMHGGLVPSVSFMHGGHRGLFLASHVAERRL